MEHKTIKFNNHRWQVTLRDEADRSVVGEIFNYREYRVAEPVIAAATHPIVDVGAHAGFFVLYVRSLNPSVPIFALEPGQENCGALKQHLKINKLETNVEVVPAALAGITGRRPLLLAPDSHNHRLASIEPKNAGATRSKILLESKIVKVFSFADFCQLHHLKKISLLKMDIEGGEYEVLPSLTAKDWARVEHLVMEYHDLQTGERHGEVEKLLRVHGFGVQIFPSQFNKTMGVLFARNKKFGIISKMG